MILVTGASGYLGQFVCRELGRSGVEFVTNKADLTQPVPALNGVTKVLHLAAKTPKTPEGYSDLTMANASLMMVCRLLEAYRCPIIFASSHVAAEPESSPYAKAKCFSEILLRNAGAHCIVRLPGLFGLPRRQGTIYDAAQRGDIRGSYGPYPSMHVEDAAWRFVQIALAFHGGDHAEEHTLTYLEPTDLERRVMVFAEELRVH